MLMCNMYAFWLHLHYKLFEKEKRNMEMEYFFPFCFAKLTSINITSPILEV